MTSSQIPPEGIRIIQELGAAVEHQWRSRNYDNRYLPAIASAALMEARLSTRLAYADLVEHVLLSEQLPAQTFRAFGQPPVTLFAGTHFYVEANFWLDGTTTIHDHGFAGAFCLLSGGSLHVRYRFEQRERINSHLHLGALHLEHTELLHAGDVRTIEPGAELIHAVYHLTKPSITIVVRNHADDRASTQREFYPPGIAENVRFNPEPLKTRLALLDAAATVDRAQYFDWAKSMLRGSNQYESYRVLGRAFAHLGNESPWPELHALVENSDPEFARTIAASFHERRRRETLARLRRKVSDDDLRFFLGLMMNIPERGVIDQLLGLRFPNQSTESLVIGWLQQLSRHGVIAHGLDDLTLEVLRCALRGFDAEETVKVLERTPYSAQRAPSQDIVRGALNTLQNLSLLRPLFVHAHKGKTRTRGDE